MEVDGWNRLVLMGSKRREVISDFAGFEEVDEAPSDTGQLHHGREN